MHKAPGQTKVRRRHPPELRRSLILKTARVCISQEGLTRATARKIALRCGISVGTLSHHFPSMDRLLADALRAGSEEYAPPVQDIVDRSMSAIGRFGLLIDHSLPVRHQAFMLWRLWIEYWARALHNRSLRTVHADRYRVWRRAVERLLSEGVRSGEFRRVDVRRVARKFVSLIDGLGIQIVLGDREMSLAFARSLARAAIASWVLPSRDGRP